MGEWHLHLFSHTYEILFDITRIYVYDIFTPMYYRTEFYLKRYTMNYRDKTITCKDCGQEFVFTASEQQFFEEKGFTNEPQRCPACRRARKNGGRPQSDQQREMFTATCSSCGRECKVPFKPKNDRPIYCSDCFASHKR